MRRSSRIPIAARPRAMYHWIPLTVVAALLSAPPASAVQVGPDFSTTSTTSASGSMLQIDDPFYMPPSPLPKGKPGEVLKTRTLAISFYPEARVTQVMYLSTNIKGNLVPVTGALLTPLGQTGTDNPLVVHTPGTRGLADSCAPSKQVSPLTADPTSPEYSSTEYQSLLLRGISVVVTDYEGQGTPGLPSYLVGPAEGQQGLDALRAVQRIPGSGVSSNSPLGISGYSQGGQASSWAAQLQAKYAPELNVKGVLTGGVPADMVALINHLDGNPTGGAGFALASLVGLDFAHPELALEERLTPEGQEVIERVKDSCYLEDFATYGTTTTGEVTEPDVLSDSAWVDRYSRSTLGATAPKAPTYVYHGTMDTIVPFALSKEMFHSWCQRGATSTFETLPGLEHLSGNILGPARGLDWLVDRLNGIEAEPGCRELGP